MSAIAVLTVHALLTVVAVFLVSHAHRRARELADEISSEIGREVRRQLEAALQNLPKVTGCQAADLRGSVDDLVLGALEYADDASQEVRRAALGLRRALRVLGEEAE